MRIPIPQGKGLECARDLARDVAELLKQRIKMREEIPDFNKKDREAFDLLGEQIRSLVSMEIVECDSVGVATDKVFIVGDYVTPKREAMAEQREAFKRTAMGRLFQNLH